jgi:cyclohexanone monooxygenase
MLVHNLPNYFQLTVIGNGLGANYLYGNGKQAEHIAWVIGRCLEDGIDSIEATREAEDEWRKVLDDSHSPELNPIFATVREFHKACTPGYLNSEGNVEDNKGILANIYGGGFLAYARLLEAWRESDMHGLTLSRSSDPVS